MIRSGQCRHGCSEAALQKLLRERPALLLHAPKSLARKLRFATSELGLRGDELAAAPCLLQVCLTLHPDIAVWLLCGLIS